MNKRYTKGIFEDKMAYLFRLVGILMEESPDDLNWKMIRDYVGLDCHYDTLRKACQPDEFGSYAVYKAVSQNEGTLSELTKAELREIKNERQKLRDERLYVNEINRKLSRTEHMLDKIRESVSEVEPIEIGIREPLNQTDKVAICGIADVHYGKDISIRGLNGEYLNVYNDKIFKERMEKLLGHYIDLIERHKLQKIAFYDLGDNIEGLLRITALKVVKYGIVDSAIRYGYYLADWLNKLSEKVEIDYYGVLGNHSEIRPLNSKSGDFSEENMEKVVREILYLRLMKNDRVTVHPNVFIRHVNHNGFIVLSTHGQFDGNLSESAIKYKEIHGIDADIFITGHKHSSKLETASLRTKVIQFPSIVGIDEYSMKIKQTAKPEAKFIMKDGDQLINIDIDLS